MNSPKLLHLKWVWKHASLVVISAGLGALAAATLPPALAGYDTNKDGVLDLNESKVAASVLFDKLDIDKHGKLDMKELHGRLSEKEFNLADKDSDKTLTKDEYLSAVERAFYAADPDGDKVLDAKELKTPAGHAFLRLLQ
jgi:hypothetical protein